MYLNRFFLFAFSFMCCVSEGHSAYKMAPINTPEQFALNPALRLISRSSPNDPGIIKTPQGKPICAFHITRNRDGINQVIWGEAVVRSGKMVCSGDFWGVKTYDQFTYIGLKPGARGAWKNKSELAGYLGQQKNVSSIRMFEANASRDSKRNYATGVCLTSRNHVGKINMNLPSAASSGISTGCNAVDPVGLGYTGTAIEQFYEVQGPLASPKPLHPEIPGAISASGRYTFTPSNQSMPGNVIRGPESPNYPVCVMHGPGGQNIFGYVKDQKCHASYGNAIRSESFFYISGPSGKWMNPDDVNAFYSDKNRTPVVLHSNVGTKLPLGMCSIQGQPEIGKKIGKNTGYSCWYASANESNSREIYHNGAASKKVRYFVPDAPAASPFEISPINSPDQFQLNPALRLISRNTPNDPGVIKTPSGKSLCAFHINNTGAKMSQVVWGEAVARNGKMVCSVDFWGPKTYDQFTYIGLKPGARGAWKPGAELSDYRSKKKDVSAIRMFSNNTDQKPETHFATGVCLTSRDHIGKIDMNSEKRSKGAGGISGNCGAIDPNALKYAGTPPRLFYEVQAPAVQAPAVQAPAVQAPAVQAPAVQAPAVQTPAVQAPAVASVPPATVEAPEELYSEMPNAISSRELFTFTPSNQSMPANVLRAPEGLKYPVCAMKKIHPTGGPYHQNVFGYVKNGECHAPYGADKRKKGFFYIVAPKGQWLPAADTKKFYEDKNRTPRVTKPSAAGNYDMGICSIKGLSIVGKSSPNLFRDPQQHCWYVDENAPNGKESKVSRDVLFFVPDAKAEPAVVAPAPAVVAPAPAVVAPAPAVVAPAPAVVAPAPAVVAPAPAVVAPAPAVVAPAPAVVAPAPLHPQKLNAVSSFGRFAFAPSTDSMPENVLRGPTAPNHPVCAMAGPDGQNIFGFVLGGKCHSSYGSAQRSESFFYVVPPSGKWLEARTVKDLYRNAGRSPIVTESSVGRGLPLGICATKLRPEIGKSLKDIKKDGRQTCWFADADQSKSQEQRSFDDNKGEVLYFVPDDLSVASVPVAKPVVDPAPVVSTPVASAPAAVPSVVTPAPVISSQTVQNGITFEVSTIDPIASGMNPSLQLISKTDQNNLSIIKSPNNKHVCAFTIRRLDNNERQVVFGETVVNQGRATCLGEFFGPHETDNFSYVGNVDGKRGIWKLEEFFMSYATKKSPIDNLRLFKDTTYPSGVCVSQSGVVGKINISQQGDPRAFCFYVDPKTRKSAGTPIGEFFVVGEVPDRPYGSIMPTLEGEGPSQADQIIEALDPTGRKNVNILAEKVAEGEYGEAGYKAPFDMGPGFSRKLNPRGIQNVYTLAEKASSLEDAENADLSDKDREAFEKWKKDQGRNFSAASRTQQSALLSLLPENVRRYINVPQ